LLDMVLHQHHALGLGLVGHELHFLE
jgi:hypothetical protein